MQEIMRHCEWPTRAEAARMVGLHRATIGRAVVSGEIETNSLRGRWTRIDPWSLRDHDRKLAARRRARHAC